MDLLIVICWALKFIIRIRFPPGKSLVTFLELIQGPQSGVTDWAKASPMLFLSGNCFVTYT